MGTEPTTSEVTYLHASNDIGLWARAYKLLQTREPELMKEYKKHLASLQRNCSTVADILTLQSIETVVKQLLDDRKKKQWRVSLLGKDKDTRANREISEVPT
ncbi:hypothetical protein N7522_007949 [Penicillium canescens]|uniref:uncharacterized protein n=1 Tax=Penicillium canescens TaxID=5083 RepID=UPI0026DEAD5B|nr:uncharacterized protein N7446_003087 [Penicillium canescens]KAJ5996289.1 hypothetical protein N7522_007949 [Penicillium canescens]KAJ6075310.1 hypothetical protein N7446_003087 [Penicillium canescens]